MTVMEIPSLMTTEQLLALPDDGVTRELIRGTLRERDDMTRRGYRHTSTEARIGRALGNWRERQPEPRGAVLSGEAGFRIAGDPDTTVGVDVAYISPALAAVVEPDTFIINGIPVLAVEILSPSDTQEQVTEKVRAYLDAAVPLVWVAEPVFRTVTVYRPDAEPAMFNATQTITGEEHLPGFTANVADFFEPPRRSRR